MFNDSVNKTGLVNDVLFRTNVTTTEFPLLDITRYINEGYDRVANVILNSDGRMEWDDSNHTDQPIASTDLINGQADYGVFTAAPAALQDWLMIERVEIFDSSGNGYLLNPIDQSTINCALSEYKDEPGIPEDYDFDGTQITLYPAPNYDYTGGLTIYFKRAPSYFISTDTTKRPGFATTFHSYLSIFAANQWNGIRKNDWSLQSLLTNMELEIGRHYSRRNKYERNVLRRKKDIYK
jgi:hypothetical protein